MKESRYIRIIYIYMATISKKQLSDITFQGPSLWGCEGLESNESEARLCGLAILALLGQVAAETLLRLGAGQGRALFPP